MLWFKRGENMYITISALPEMRFSHIYKADVYKSHFKPRRDFLEISYVSEGSLCVQVNNESICAKQGDVICLFNHDDTFVVADQPHCHHTVGVSVVWEETDDEENALMLPLVTQAHCNTEKICRLIDDMINLIETNLGSEDEWISWYLWEIDKNKPEGEINNHVWLEHEGKHYKLTIDSPENLYYLITNQIDNIENKVEEEPPECDFVEPTVEHPNFTGETLYDVFMRSMGNYTESEN